MRILFQGDSITDSGRFDDFNNIGNGFVKLIKEELKDDHVLNRGISGNTTDDLLVRWKIDAIDINADIVFILIGVNDVWHHYWANRFSSIEKIEINYEKLVSHLKKANNEVKVVLIEPFAYLSDLFLSHYFPFLNDVKTFVKKLSIKQNTYFIPMQSVFDSYLNKFETKELLYDGIHPTELGNEIIKKEVLKVINLIKTSF